jgi:hypothetical protein
MRAENGENFQHINRRGGNLPPVNFPPRGENSQPYGRDRAGEGKAGGFAGGNAWAVLRHLQARIAWGGQSKPRQAEKGEKLGGSKAHPKRCALSFARHVGLTLAAALFLSLVFVPESARADDPLLSNLYISGGGGGSGGGNDGNYPVGAGGKGGTNAGSGGNGSKSWVGAGGGGAYVGDGTTTPGGNATGATGGTGYTEETSGTAGRGDNGSGAVGGAGGAAIVTTDTLDAGGISIESGSGGGGDYGKDSATAGASGAGGAATLKADSVKAGNGINIESGSGGNNGGGRNYGHGGDAGDGGAATLEVTGSVSANSVSIQSGSGGNGGYSTLTTGGVGGEIRFKADDLYVVDSIGIKSGNGGGGGEGGGNNGRWRDTGGVGGKVTLDVGSLKANSVVIASGNGGYGGGRGTNGGQGGDGGAGGRIELLVTNALTVTDSISITSGIPGTASSGGAGAGGSATLKAGTLIAPIINLTRQNGGLSAHVGTLDVVEGTTLNLDRTSAGTDDPATNPGVFFKTIDLASGKTLAVTRANNGTYGFSTLNVFGNGAEYSDTQLTDGSVTAANVLDLTGVGKTVNFQDVPTAESIAGRVALLEVTAGGVKLDGNTKIKITSEGEAYWTLGPTLGTLSSYNGAGWSALTLIHTSGSDTDDKITGTLANGSVVMDDVSLPFFTPSELQNFLTGTRAHSSEKKLVVVEGLAWYRPANAHGTFNVAAVDYSIGFTLGTALDNVADVTSPLASSNWANNPTGQGKDLKKTGNGVLILSSDKNTYSGLTTIEGGLLKITGLLGYNPDPDQDNVHTGGFTINATGAGTGLLFNQSVDQTLDGPIIGVANSLLTQAGTGTATLSIAYTKLSGFLGTLDPQSGVLNLTATGTGDMMFNNKLAGSENGILRFDLNGRKLVFDSVFTDTNASSFTGTVELTNATLDLDSTNVQTVLGANVGDVPGADRATLQLSLGGMATTGGSKIHALTFDGGTLELPKFFESGTDFLHVGKLTVDPDNLGTIQLDFKLDPNPPPDPPGADLDANDFDFVKADALAYLIKADEVDADSVGRRLSLLDKEGSSVPGDGNSSNIVIKPSVHVLSVGVDPDKETFGEVTLGYIAEVVKNQAGFGVVASGVLLEYGVAKIAAYHEKTVTLDLEKVSSKTPTLGAVLTDKFETPQTGQVNGSFTFTGSADAPLRVGNTSSDYHGTTTVKQIALTAMTSNAFGLTSELALKENAEVTFEASVKQTVGALNSDDSPGSSATKLTLGADSVLTVEATATTSTDEASRTFAGLIEGEGILAQGTGESILTGLLTSGLEVNAGTFRVLDTGRLGDEIGDKSYDYAKDEIPLAAGGILEFNQAEGVTQTLGGAITGDGKLIQKGANSQLILTGSLTSGLEVNAGMFRVLDAGSLGEDFNYTKDISLDGTLEFNQAAGIVQTLIGALTGGGKLIQNAADPTAKLILNAENNIVGLVEARNGKLIVGGKADENSKATLTARGGVVVGSSADDRAVLGGHGTIVGNVTIGEYGTLAPGNSIGTTFRITENLTFGEKRIDQEGISINVDSEDYKKWVFEVELDPDTKETDLEITELDPEIYRGDRVTVKNAEGTATVSPNGATVRHVPLDGTQSETLAWGGKKWIILRADKIDGKFNETVDETFLKSIEPRLYYADTDGDNFPDTVYFCTFWCFKEEDNVAGGPGVPGVSLVNQGADFVIDRGIAAVLHENVRTGRNLFAVVGGGKSRYRTGGGSHSDVVSTAVVAGASVSRAVRAGELMAGAFFEHGTGRYDTVTSQKSRGKGDARYMGGGVFALLELEGTKKGNFYAEASARRGKLAVDFRLPESSDTGAGRASADESRTSDRSRPAYGSAHVGVGYALKESVHIYIFIS